MKPANECPYLKPVVNHCEKEVIIEEDFELQYNEQHIVEEVKVGETDLVKEVNSHINEVGLSNVIKNAIAHGEDPMTKFGKVEAGVPVALDINTTMDELLEQCNKNKEKYAEIAKNLGVSVEELQAAVASGSLDAIINKSVEEANQEGGAE